MTLVHILLSKGRLDFSSYLAYDDVQIILIPNLKFLMMTATLATCPPFKNLAKPIEDFELPSRSLVAKMIEILNHKLEIDLVFRHTPFPQFYYLAIRPIPRILHIIRF